MIGAVVASMSRIVPYSRAPAAEAGRSADCASMPCTTRHPGRPGETVDPRPVPARPPYAAPVLERLRKLDRRVLRVMRTRGHSSLAEAAMGALGTAGEHGAVWM